MTKYPSVEAVIRLHAEVVGQHVGIVDRATLEGALARPQAGYGDHIEYPTVWLKAGVLLHGLASTQSFRDGNKRLAWAAALAFLKTNRHPLRLINTLTAEVLVLATATSAITVDQVAGWLQEHAAAAPRPDSDEIEMLRDVEVGAARLGGLTRDGGFQGNVVRLTIKSGASGEVMAQLARGQEPTTVTRHFAIGTERAKWLAVRLAMTAQHLDPLIPMSATTEEVTQRPDPAAPSSSAGVMPPATSPAPADVSSGSDVEPQPRCSVMKCAALEERVWHGAARGHLQDAGVCEEHHAAMSVGEPFDIDVEVVDGYWQTVVRMGTEREDGTYDLLGAQQSAPATGYRAALTLRPHGREDLMPEVFDIRVSDDMWTSLFGDDFARPGG
ncbi:Fic family protein [Pseudokineococcus sp. 1T1Z-3]|uniref:Fic family protein n=1 Tax=Pseudokineococcus sp. 1T1Z-3 TaxID=3132745 RepID=UPI0030B32160